MISSNWLSLLLTLLCVWNFTWNGISGQRAKICNLKMRIYHPCDTTMYEDFCVEDSLSLFKSQYFQLNNCNTVIVGLPFLTNVTSYNVVPMIDALTSRCEFNIILLDNSASTNAATSLSYPFTVKKVYADSLLFAEALNKAIDHRLLQGRCIKALGFSLGAQIMGHVCRHLKQRCCQLFAIDPAGPLFTPGKVAVVTRFQPHTQGFSRSDACRVIKLESNSPVMGTPFRNAHVNIVVNGGNIQPPCSEIDVLCSHEFGNRLMMFTIENPNGCLMFKSPDAANYIDPARKDMAVFNFPFPESCDADTYSCNSNANSVYHIVTGNEPKCGESSADTTGIRKMLRLMRG